MQMSRQQTCRRSPQPSWTRMHQAITQRCIEPGLAALQPRAGALLSGYTCGVLSVICGHRGNSPHQTSLSQPERRWRRQTEAASLLSSVLQDPIGSCMWLVYRLATLRAMLVALGCTRMVNQYCTSTHGMSHTPPQQQTRRHHPR